MQERQMKKRRLMVHGAMAAIASAGLMAVPVSAPVLARTAQPQAIQPFSQAEKNQGAQAHTEILQEFGGAMSGRQADYVRGVGQTIAVQSGLSTARSDFTVTLLNSAVNNAFALPGGYIYTTRQLVGLMNNEAELAGVLGHEVGHTAARHSKARQRRATRNSILGVLGTIVGGMLGDNGGLAGTVGGLLQNNAMRAAQLATLGYSRSQETQADDLGIRYLAGAGYDPTALSTMLASLAAQNTLDQRAAGQDARSIPEWASTHPDPASRVRRALTQAQAQRVTNGRLNRDTFLTAIDGLMYGDDPRQGVVEGRDFLHPDLRLAFTVPQGFGMSNGATAVTVSGNSGQAQFTTAAYSGDLDAYVRNVFQQLVSASNGSGSSNSATPQLGQITRTTVNGIPAAYASARAQAQNGPVDVTIFAYGFSNSNAYHFVAITPQGQMRVFDPLFGSVRRLTDREAAAVRAREVDVVTVRRGDTLQSLSARMAYPSLQLERFLVLNGLTSTSTLTPGQKVKIVTYSS
mgnify:CR=1 FL=1